MLVGGSSMEERRAKSWGLEAGQADFSKMLK